MRGPNGLITRPPSTETIHQVKTHYKMESVIVLGAQCSLLNTISPAFSLSLFLSVPPPLALFLSLTCTHSHTLFPHLPLRFLRQSLWFQQAHMHGAGSTPPSISPLLLFWISIRVSNACLVPYWIRLMSLLTAFSLRQTCNGEEMRTGLLINRPTFHHASQVAGWTSCWWWSMWGVCLCCKCLWEKEPEDWCCECITPRLCSSTSWTRCDLGAVWGQLPIGQDRWCSV